MLEGFIAAIIIVAAIRRQGRTSTREDTVAALHHGFIRRVNDAGKIRQ